MASQNPNTVQSFGVRFQFLGSFQRDGYMELAGRNLPIQTGAYYRGGRGTDWKASLSTLTYHANVRLTVKKKQALNLEYTSYHEKKCPFYNKELFLSFA